MKVINFIKRYNKKIAILLFFLLCLICGIYFYGKIVQVIPADTCLLTTVVLQAEKSSIC
ncbi:MAG: hypothetical protein RR253_03700 [Oscillospiraceae bacterium]